MVPRGARDDPDSFELSVSNANGADLLCALGLASEPGGGPVPIDQFRWPGDGGGASPSRHRSTALATVEDVQKGRLTVVLVGRPEGYIERRLSDLMTLIQRSRAVGATHLDGADNRASPDHETDPWLLPCRCTHPVRHRTLLLCSANTSTPRAQSSSIRGALRSRSTAIFSRSTNRPNADSRDGQTHGLSA